MLKDHKTNLPKAMVEHVLSIKAMSYLVTVTQKQSEKEANSKSDGTPRCTLLTKTFFRSRPNGTLLNKKSIHVNLMSSEVNSRYEGTPMGTLMSIQVLVKTNQDGSTKHKPSMGHQLKKHLSKFLLLVQAEDQETVE